MSSLKQPSRTQRPDAAPRAQDPEAVGWLRLLSWLLIPGVIAGWRLRRALGEREWAWRRRGTAHTVRIVFIGCTAAAACWIVWLVAGVVFGGREVNVHPVAALSIVLLVQLAVGVSMALLTLPHRWALLLRGDLPAGQEDALTRAGIEAAVADAYTRIRQLHAARLTWLGQYIRRTPLAYIGTVVKVDHRWLLSRALDKTRRRPRGWFTRGGIAVLPDRVPRMLVHGASGHGKTVAINAVLRACLQRQMRTMFVDCKGAPADAEFLLAMAERMGKRAVCWPDTPMDLWRGDRHTQISIVKTLLPRHPYWENLATWVLHAITVDAGPWRSTAELLDRLLDPRSVVTDSKVLTALRQRSGQSPAHMVIYQVVAAQLDPIASLIDGGEGSWAIDDEDIDLIIVSADIGANQELAACLSGLIADFNAYRVARREPHARPLMVAFDEVQVLLGLTQPPDLAWLAEQCRSQDIGVLYATQSVAGLGTSAPRILGAGMDLLIGRLDDPNLIVEQTGTRRVAEHGWQKELGTFTTVATARTQHTHRLDPNEIRETEKGSWLLISQGRIAHIAIERPHLGPANPSQEPDR